MKQHLQFASFIFVQSRLQAIKISFDISQLFRSRDHQLMILCFQCFPKTFSIELQNQFTKKIDF